MKTKLLILHLLFIFFTLTSSLPSRPLSFTTFGTTIVDHNSITLTPHTNIGRVFYKNPIRFYDPFGNSSLSFFTSFSFTINTPPPPYLSGEGLAFLITSDPHSLSHAVGRIGLPESLDSSFLAVEFDTSFDQGLGDINDNHVGVDLDSVISVASVDLKEHGIDLKSGKEITVWIEYRDSQKFILIWVSYSQKMKAEDLILATPIDLSTRLNGSMYVGFSASTGRGSAIHSIDSWYFKTRESGFFFTDEDLGSEETESCFMFHDVLSEETKSCRSTESVEDFVLMSIFLFGNFGTKQM